MGRRTKIQRLLILGAGLATLLLLAGALGTLTLAPGRHFALDFSWLMHFETYDGEMRAEWLFVALRLLILIAFVLAPVGLIAALLDSQLRRRVLRSLLLVGMMVIAAWALQSAERFSLAPREQESQAVEFFDDEVLASDAFSAPSALVVWSASVGLALLLLASAGTVLVMVWRHKRLESLPLRLLAEEAEVALEALREGADLRSVIIRCYAEMERVVAKTRGLQRQDGMTAREFETQLRRLGLPEGPVMGLVQLFEAARYGNREPGEAEEKGAIESLSAIVAACRGSG